VAATALAVGWAVRSGSSVEPAQPAPEASAFRDPARWERFDLRAVVPRPPAPWIASATTAGGALYVVPATGAQLLRHAGAALDAGWSVFDATAVSPGAAQADALPAAVSDGNYVYVSPLGDGGALRYDPALPFDRAESWPRFDLAAVVAPAGMLGNALFDGRFVYFGPQDEGRVVRYDTTAAFTDAAAWSSASLGVGADAPFGGGRFGGAVPATGPRLAAFVGAAFDGRYAYWVPAYHRGWSGVIPRYDTTRPFDDAGAWDQFDARAVDPRAEGFAGAAFDGRWLVFAPGFTDDTWWSGVVVAYDTTAPFDAPSSWTTFDLGAVDRRAKGYSGIVFDGRWLTLVPFDAEWGGVAVRHDTRAAFDAGWEAFDLASLHPAAVGFAAGVAREDGLWLLPYWGDRGSEEDRPAFVVRWTR
jgi:hypothetical protein